MSYKSPGKFVGVQILIPRAGAGPEVLCFWQASHDAADLKTPFESHLGLNTSAAAGDKE